MYEPGTVSLFLIPVAYSTASGLIARVESDGWSGEAAEPDGADRATA